jgi:hypothetical protein
MTNKKIKVEREPYEYEGKTYNNYLVKGVISGKEVKVKLAPPDKGGYSVLDIVFANGRDVELLTKPYELRDASGKVTKGNTYLARSVGENGEVYDCKLKPARDSDKNLLEMLLAQK